MAKALKGDPEQEAACRNTVARCMRELGLKIRVFRSFMPTTTQADTSKMPAPNRLDQNFTADAPDRKWVTDITYLSTDQGWVYLAVVLDLFSRKVVGWALSPSLATEFVFEALRNAMEARKPQAGKLLHQSDRGCQYTSDAHQAQLKLLGIECSMSRTGCCYDNAVMERFFWSLKYEWTNHQEHANLQDALKRQDLVGFLLNNLLGKRLLRSHRVDRDDRALNVHQPQKPGNRGDFVRFVIAGDLPQRQS